jgi:hypothetical protein
MGMTLPGKCGAPGWRPRRGWRGAASDESLARAGWAFRELLRWRAGRSPDGDCPQLPQWCSSSVFQTPQCWQRVMAGCSKQTSNL